MQPHNPPFDCTYATLGICTGFEWDILQQIDCGIALCASDGQTLVKFNPAFASLHGYAVAQLAGKPLSELVASDRRALGPEQMLLPRELNNYTFESRHLRADGTTFPILMQIKTLKNEIGNVIYYLICVKDITKRQLLEYG